LANYDFPLWLRVTHYVNFLLITLLLRSGIQILADHPRLYWNEHCTPGSEWIRFSRKRAPKNQLWTSMDEAIQVSPWVGLPGGWHTLGLARHWHFIAALFWMLNGLIYVALLFLNDQWGRLIPTSGKVFAEAWHSLLDYLTLHVPPLSSFHPYDGLQQLAYASIVFLVAPFTILTGAAMSPAIAARFPWYPGLFGGRQKARSLHFLLLLAYLSFMVVHVSMVFLVHFTRNADHIVLGREQGQEWLAIAIGALLILSVALINWLVTWWSHQAPRQVQHWTGLGAQLFDNSLSMLHSRQAYDRADISPYFWVNGKPPADETWQRMANDQFKDWHLEITGLVEKPIRLSLDDLKSMPKHVQITEHVCIQGWSGIAEWAGVQLSEIIGLCRPKGSAQYLVFHSYQRDPEGIEYYSSLTLEEANDAQSMLAYEMNGQLLPLEHGAPVRLRVETKLGFKMTKWIRAVEFVADYKEIGLGQGGYREDREYYAIGAAI